MERKVRAGPRSRPAKTVAESRDFVHVSARPLPHADASCTENLPDARRKISELQLWVRPVFT